MWLAAVDTQPTFTIGVPEGTVDLGLSGLLELLVLLWVIRVIGFNKPIGVICFIWFGGSWAYLFNLIFEAIVIVGICGVIWFIGVI